MEADAQLLQDSAQLSRYQAARELKETLALCAGAATAMTVGHEIIERVLPNSKWSEELAERTIKLGTVAVAVFGLTGAASALHWRVDAFLTERKLQAMESADPNG